LFFRLLVNSQCIYTTHTHTHLFVLLLKRILAVFGAWNNAVKRDYDVFPQKCIKFFFMYTLIYFVFYALFTHFIYYFRLQTVYIYIYTHTYQYTIFHIYIGCFRFRNHWLMSACFVHTIFVVSSCPPQLPPRSTLQIMSRFFFYYYYLLHSTPFFGLRVVTTTINLRF